MAVGDPVLVELLRDQVAPRDLHLLFVGVAAEVQDLHAIAKRGRNGIRLVRGRDEHHVREIERQVHVVIAERVVLLRIEDLEKRRRRIAAEVLSELVELVDHEHRVVRPRLLQTLDHAPWHRADVGAAVSTNLRFVAHAAERDAHELSAERSRDRFPERGLADARRPDEAEDRALHLLLQLAHAEKFQDALLHLLQVEVILVEDALRLLEIDLVGGRLGPRHVHEPVEVRAHHRRFRRVWVHRLEALQLLRSLARHFFRHRGFGDLLLEVVELFVLSVRVAELVLDGPELFAKEILLLHPVHLLLGLRLDAGLHGEELVLAQQVLVHFPEALDRIDRLEDLLAVVDLESEVRRDEIREAPGVVHVIENRQQIGGEDLAERDHLLEVFAHGADQRLRFQLGAGRRLLAEALDRHLVEGLRLHELLRVSAEESLHQDLHAAVGQLPHAHDDGDGAVAVDLVLGGFLLRRVLLRGEKDQTILRERVVDGLDRRLAADEQRQDHEREHDHVPDGEHGQRVRNLQLFGLDEVVFGHGLPPGTFGRSRLDRNLAALAAAVLDLRELDGEEARVVSRADAARVDGARDLEDAAEAPRLAL